MAVKPSLFIGLICHDRSVAFSIGIRFNHCYSIYTVPQIDRQTVSCQTALTVLLVCSVTVYSLSLTPYMLMSVVYMYCIST